VSSKSATVAVTPEIADVILQQIEHGDIAAGELMLTERLRADSIIGR